MSGIEKLTLTIAAVVALSACARTPEDIALSEQRDIVAAMNKLIPASVTHLGDPGELDRVEVNRFLLKAFGEDSPIFTKYEKLEVCKRYGAFTALHVSDLMKAQEKGADPLSDADFKLQYLCRWLPDSKTQIRHWDAKRAAAKK
jgi:hypothetical protein